MVYVFLYFLFFLLLLLLLVWEDLCFSLSNPKLLNSKLKKVVLFICYLLLLRIFEKGQDSSHFVALGKENAKRLLFNVEGLVLKHSPTQFS